MTTRSARITWLTPEEGGRRAPPSGPRYSAPVRFESQAAGAEGANWSLVVDRISYPPGSADWIAEVRFLFDDAPHELLLLGSHFELYEGKKCVARGVIINPVPEKGLNNFCADLVSSKRWEAFLAHLLTEKRAGEWVAVREFCLQAGLDTEEVKSDLFATWLGDPTGDEAYAVILFYDDESMWTMAARYNRQRLMEGVPAVGNEENLNHGLHG